MENKKNTCIKFTALSVFIFTLLFTGCEKDDDPKAPDLPPVVTFIMDFTDFGGGQQKHMALPSTVKSSDASTAVNWGWAASNVLVWNTVLFVNLAVPVASFYEAFNHEGVYQGDNEWTWAYNFMGGTYEAELHGILSENQVEWEMYISKEDVYSDFLWYSGTSNLTLTEGQWLLNRNPDDPNPYLQIDWTRSVDDESADIKYKNVMSGNDYYDSYIYYGRNDGTTYDLFYDIYNSLSQNLINIEWNQTTKEGRVKDSEHFGDELWHCWDASLQDTVCD